MDYEVMWHELKEALSDTNKSLKQQRDYVTSDQSKVEYSCVIEGLETARREMRSIEKHFKNSDLPRKYAAKKTI
jgi:uncharacterized coiled-coil DUF342 family protein